MKMAEYAMNRMRNIREAEMYTRRQDQDPGGLSCAAERRD
jgi:hypothetical protein